MQPVYSCLHCQFLCYALKALSFIKIALKLSYFSKKTQNVQVLGIPPLPESSCLRLDSAVVTGGPGGVPPLTTSCASHFGLLRIRFLEHLVTTRQQTIMEKGIL